jgi:hypothetical protein
MKKYLINGALALIVGFTYTSCKNNDVDYVPIAQQKTQAYAEAFKEMIGGEVDPNQNWGFETITISEEELAAVRAGSRAGTRAGEPEVVKKDQWENFPDRLDGNTVPPDVTTKEAEYVYQWFQNNPGLTIEGRPWSNFFLQQVYGTMNLQKKGIWHRYDQNYMANHPGATSNYYDEEFTDKGGMDYLTVGDGTTMTHVNDFNAESGGPWNIVYMKNSSALQFGYHSTWDNSERQRFKLAEIEVPGSCFTDGVARKGWYVGLSLLAEKEDNGKKVLGEQRKDYGDDWILKVVPGEGETEITNVGGGENSNSTTITNAKFERKKLMLQGRVFCEDLAKATRGDIDFNDIVFDARIWRVSEFTKTNGVDNNNDRLLRYEAEICLLAAGGTIPANVAKQDVHNLFGVGLTTMVNTVDDNSNVTITWGNSDTTRPVKNITFNMSDLIDDNTREISLDLIPIEVMWTTSDTNDAGIGQMKSVGLLGANVGDVPYKFCAPIGTAWASERNPIIEVYSGFADWAKGGSEPNWGNGTNLRYNNCPNGLSTDSKYVIGYTEEKQISSTSTTTTEIETVLWQGSRAMEYSAGGNNGKYAMVFNSKDIKVGDKMRIYGTKSTGNATLVLKNNENGWQDIVSINLSDLNNYKEIDVTEGMVNAMTSTTVNSWGRGCSITKITRWRKTVTTN